MDDPIVQPLLSHHPPASELRGHRLLFRLAEMPDNEQLVAGSLRLRYRPLREKKGNFTTKRIRTQCDRLTVSSHYWPVTLWLHYDVKDQSGHWNFEAVGSFEPDEPICEQSFGMNNRTLLHLPVGWFHFPLGSTILSLLEKKIRENSAGRYLTIQLRSLSLPFSVDRTLNELRLNSRSRNASETVQWLHDAPHLFTYHRDPEIVPEAKRIKRSVPISAVGPNDSLGKQKHAEKQRVHQMRLKEGNGQETNKRRRQKVSKKKQHNENKKA